MVSFIDPENGTEELDRAKNDELLSKTYRARNNFYAARLKMKIRPGESAAISHDRRVEEMMHIWKLGQLADVLHRWYWQWNDVSW